MRKIALATTAAAVLAVPATAEANYSHIVEPGETLTSIASTDGLSLSALAEANGLSSTSQLKVGQVVEIPPLTRYTSTRSAARAYVTHASAAPESSGSSSTATSTPSAGVYRVRRGDTLSAIAARAGTTVAHLAAINGLSPNHYLIAGTTLRLSGTGGTTTSVTSSGASASASSRTGAGSAGTGAYVVRRGDTLSAIAIRAGTTIAHLAAINGLNPNHYLIAGTTLKLSAGASAGRSYVSTAASSGSAGSSYVVQPGDSLGAIATRIGTTVNQLAALNGLNPRGYLLIGQVLTLPGGAASGATASSSGPATGSGNQQIAGATSGGPYPTAETVTSSEIGSEAAAAGLDPSLAEAIGWQESGFNNDLVSSTGAVGVMQIEPATWSWINQVLTPGAPLNPSSAYDNVRGGVLLLHNLVSQTGSDALASAAYYQGLQSVRDHGLYSDTQQYVNDVAALQHHFGG